MPTNRGLGSHAWREGVGGEMGNGRWERPQIPTFSWALCFYGKIEPWYSRMPWMLVQSRMFRTNDPRGAKLR